MDSIRFATFNSSLNRSTGGELIDDLSTPNNEQAQAVAEIIQRNHPDVLLINEFDFDQNGEAAQLFQDNYLAVSQSEGVDPVNYPYVYSAPSNTGIPSGFDLNNDGEIGGPDDAFGFGFFPGQFGMLLLSKHPIVEEEIRTFQNFLWQDMPGALLPDDPTTAEPNDWYSEAELAEFRLSSKSHWDIPINVNGEIIHVLAAHPTPPTFDGEEDRNGLRNHDEIRFWADYINPAESDYIYDDNGNVGGLGSNDQFVILGDYNADPFDGDSSEDAALQFTENPLINNTVIPSSEGGVAAAERQGGLNETHIGNPAFDTADFGPDADVVGNLRVDYALPSANLNIADSSVFWPPEDDPRFDLVGDFPFPSSDHRLVSVDIVNPRENPARNSVTAIELLGETSIPTGTEFAGTTIGGLSGLAYDAANGVYYALSDDRGSDSSEPRFYTLEIDLSDGSLEDGDVNFVEVTTLSDAEGNLFADGSIDPEGIALTEADTLYIASEGNANELIAPFVNEFSLDGQQLSELPVDEKFIPNAEGTVGIRNNLAFESTTITPDGRFLYTATENALHQDSPAADVDQESISRIIKYDLTTGEAVAEFGYNVDPVADVPNPEDAFRTNGLVELLAVDNNGTLLALERSFSVGAGNTVKLYEVQTQGALDVSSEDDLFREEPFEDDGETVEPAPFVIDPAVIKEELLDFEADLGITPDNLEALAFGPTLEDGRQTLTIVSDNNFSDTQTNQFITVAVDLDSIPLAQPTVETPLTQDSEAATTPLQGDSDDPAIWVHPSNPDESLVIATLKDGGAVVFDLQGEIVQTITPADVDPSFEFGEIRYNNVDIVYNLELPSQVAGESTPTDVAVFSDRANDTLAIFGIDPDSGTLFDLTAPNLSNSEFSIFGVDDGEATAYGLATYTSPVSGQSYAFVTQADGNQVAQLELQPQIGAADAVSIDAEVVRTIDLPVPTGDSEDSQSEGLVVDEELGFGYVALEERVGILKFSAEPDGGEDLRTIQLIEQEALVPDIEGLELYYSADGTGYLVASSQGDSSYAVYSREGNNQFLGSFAVGENGSIDQVNESDGLDIINVSLGSAFPNGLAVFQDGANDPQNPVPDEEELENNSTNFKFVPWEEIANGFEIPLDIDPISFDPRNPEPNTLPNGVASGDVTQETAVLLARSTVTGEVTFEVATSPNFNNIVQTLTATVTDINLPAKVQVADLNPDTEYYYRVTDAAGTSEIGEFETSAESGTNGFRFAITGDWQQAPPYPSLGNVPERDPEVFVQLGDTIYADLETPAIPGVSQARELSEFRLKHAEVVSERFGLNTVPDIYSSTSVLSTIDDHEIVDNFAGGTAPGESADAPDIGSSDEPLFTDDVEFVNDTQVYEDALQAFQEYHPLEDRFYDTPDNPRTDGERQLYRANQYGDDAKIMITDSRSFRDAQIDPVNLTDPQDIGRFQAEAFDPNRTLLGKPQLELLKADLLEAQAEGVTWKFVVIPEPIQNFGVVNAEDRFEGYAAERTELLQFIDENDIENTVFLAGDFHGTIVNNLTYQTSLTAAPIAIDAFEIVTGPVAFNDGRFGPNVVNLSAAAGFLSEEELAFYNSLPINPDPDNDVNDRDDFVKQLLNDQVNSLGLDPFGLNDNLESAEGLIDAELLQGDYLSTHTFSWTELDIDQETQQLTVTTYGTEAYSEEELVNNPAEIVNRTPDIVSQFTVNPTGFTPDSGGEETPSAPTFGSLEADILEAGEQDIVFAGEGDDELFAASKGRLFAGTGNDILDATAGGGENRLYGGSGDDDFFAGSNDRLLGGEGSDRVFVLAGGNNLITGGADADQFWIANAQFPASANTITDFTIGEDVLGIGGIDSISSFADLTLVAEGSDTLISGGDNALARLLGINPSELSADQFVIQNESAIG